jgi:tetratricopeptide (TPR) repeat protein
MDKAIEDYTKVIGILCDPFAKGGYDYVKYRLNKPDINKFEEKMVIIQDAKIFNDRGMAYTAQGETTKAIADYTKSIEISPRYKLPYKNRAVVYFLSGEYEKSRQDMKKAKSLGATIHPEFTKELNKALKKTNNPV